MAVKKSKPSNPNVQFLEAIKALCFEREISEEDLFDAIEAALVVAYKKNFDAAQNVEVNIDRETGTYHVYALKTVVEHIDDRVTQISALDAHVLDPRYEIGDIVTDFDLFALNDHTLNTLRGIMIPALTEELPEDLTEAQPMKEPPAGPLETLAIRSRVKGYYMKAEVNPALVLKGE